MTAGDFDVIGATLRCLHLIQVPRAAIVDRGPERAAHVAHASGSLGRRLHRGDLAHVGAKYQGTTLQNRFFDLDGYGMQAQMTSVKTSGWSPARSLLALRFLAGGASPTPTRPGSSKH